MGLRGQLRNPDSQRGVREFGRDWKPEPPEPITPPKWLTAKQNVLFLSLVEDATAAKVPIKQADAHAFAMAAKCILLCAESTDANEFSRLNRDAITWLKEIGGTPQARARLGLRGRSDDKPVSKLAQLIARPA